MLRQSPTTIQGSALLRAIARRKLQSIREERARALGQESETSHNANEQLVRDAIRYGPWHWMRNHCRTHNPHWKEEGYSSPELPFPDKPYFAYLVDYLADPETDVALIEKSRDMMLTWSCVGYFLFEAMTVPAREIVFQTLEDVKAQEMVAYARQLWRTQPGYLREAFPLTKPIEKMAANELTFANGSAIWGIPGGKDKLRSYHPWGYLNDETSFQAEAGECYDNALSACVKIVLNSTANAGWYSDMRNDVNA